MSFSREVKEELINVRLRKGTDAVMLVAGATLASASLKFSRSLRNWGLQYVSESSASINFIAKLACRSYELESVISLNEHERLKAKNIELFLYGNGLDRLCADSGLVSFDENGDKLFDKHIPDGVGSEHAFRAFIRGMFLACGTVSDPKTGCNAELVLKNENIARAVSELLEERDIPPKVIKRKNVWVVYMKSGDTVEDFLTFMGAGESMLEVREQRMLREVKNNSNREINCLSANMDKAAKASAAQMEAISLIMTNLGPDALNEELYDVARARMENPEYSLSELSESLGLGRSAVNYRLKKIMAIADDIKGEA